MIPSAALDVPRDRSWKSELEIVREELVKSSIEEVAKKIDRTPKAIRNMLRRNRFSLREIRCDLFSGESLGEQWWVRLFAEPCVAVDRRAGLLGRRTVG